MRIELAAAIAVPRPLDRRDAGLGQALAEIRLEAIGELLLRPTPELARGADVVRDDLVEIDLGRRRWRGRVFGGPSRPLYNALDW